MMPAKHTLYASQNNRGYHKGHYTYGKIEFVSTILKACKKEWHEGVPAYHDFPGNIADERVSAYIKYRKQKTAVIFIPGPIGCHGW